MTSSTAPLTLRAIANTDFEPWLALWLAYQDFYQVELGETVNHTTFQRLLDSNEPMFAAVAEQNGELVG
ncbi:GNAT family N-acetyltransferase, partial [Pseudomonas sp. MAFF212428]|nr:GNAT family N-acetyltransferase [Pseudomonas brassicae]